VEKILPPDDCLENRTDYGTHVVRHYNGIHWKRDPFRPGVEFAVDSLFNLVCGEGSTPTTLLKIKEEDKEHIFLASKTVEGVNLQFILEQHKELLSKVDLFNFSGMIISGLLVDPHE